MWPVLLEAPFSPLPPPPAACTPMHHFNEKWSSQHRGVTHTYKYKWNLQLKLSSSPFGAAATPPGALMSTPPFQDRLLDSLHDPLTSFQLPPIKAVFVRLGINTTNAAAVFPCSVTPLYYNDE